MGIVSLDILGLVHDTVECVYIISYDSYSLSYSVYLVMRNILAHIKCR